MRRPIWIVLAFLILGLWLWSQHGAPAPTGVSGPSATMPQAIPVALGDAATGSRDAATARVPDFLPPEAHDVLRRIAQGGPFPHPQDGSVFQNRERHLPTQPRGYYREYTVDTPGSSDRGARRLITGGEPPREYWYTDDHYRSFRQFSLPLPEASR
jgi:guanyl-specific ribonuclease Sa